MAERIVATIEARKDGKKGDQDLVIRLPLLNPPVPSGTGKSLVVASTRGNAVTELEVNGKNVTIGVNAYIKGK